MKFTFRIPKFFPRILNFVDCQNQQTFRLGMKLVKLGMILSLTDDVEILTMILPVIHIANQIWCCYLRQRTFVFFAVL